MSGGAPASPFPVAPTFSDPVNGMTFADAADLNAEIASRQASDLDTSNAQLATNQTTNTANESTFQQALAKAQGQATTNADSYFTDNGYDPTQYASQIAQAIQTASGNVFDPNAGLGTTTPVTNTSFDPAINAAFSPNLGAQILQGINSGVQSKATNAISSEFAPTYAQDQISNDWLAPAAASAIGAQFDPLSDQLTNALKRGTLNQTGYDAALQSMTSAKTAAQSTVNELGSNILANDRTGLDNYIMGAKNDAADVNADTFAGFDPTKYLTGAGNLVSQDQGNFSGDLTNAIGKTSFDDIGTLLNAGGVVQGANDPTATNPIGAPGAGGVGIPGGGGVSDAYIAQQALANQNRGLGSSGAF